MCIRDSYKGIKALTLDLNLIPDHKVFTLVGLNESGKTTILEAINDFEFEVPEAERHLLIPKSAAGGFSDSISIVSELELSEEDKKVIEKLVKTKTNAKVVIVSDTLRIERKYKFENSNPGETKRSYWHFVKIKKTTKSKEVDLCLLYTSLVKSTNISLGSLHSKRVKMVASFSRRSLS